MGDMWLLDFKRARHTVGNGHIGTMYAHGRTTLGVQLRLNGREERVHISDMGTLARKQYCKFEK